MTMFRAASSSRRRSIGRWTVIGVATALLLTGCTDEGRDDLASAIDNAGSQLPTDFPTGLPTDLPSADAGTSDPVQTVAQATTAAVTEAPATEAPVTEDPASEAPASEREASVTEADDATDGDTTNWVPIVIIALIVLLLAWLLISAMRRSSDRRRAGAAARSGRLGEVLGTGRWIHDQGIPEIQRTNDPAQLEQFWQATRQRMVAMEEETTSMLLDAEGDPLANALKQLNDSSQGLRSAVDGDVAMRSQSAVNPELMAESMRTVQERRREFNQALERLATFR